MNPANKKAANIDEKHTEMLNLYHSIETETIPQLTQELTELTDRIRTLKDHQIDDFMDLRDQILKKRREIKDLKTKKKQYLLENAQYVFQYFEQKKEIATGGGNQNTNTLNSFFKIRAAAHTNDSTAVSDRFNQAKRQYQNYWRNVTGELTNIQDFVVQTDVCQSCGKGELIPQDEEGILICNNQECGKYIMYIVDSSKPNNKEPPNEVSYTAYIRLNHFKEILSQFQAKETTQIPDDVIEAIRARIKKERITDMKQIDYNKMREILRKLGLNKYFEHIQFINSIFGIKPPIMSEELHETLCVLFIEIQKPWAVHCPPDRTNFFNYTYTLYQLCTLLDQTQYLPYIPLLKDATKQKAMDEIWKKVCRDLDWEYIPTI